MMDQDQESYDQGYQDGRDSMSETIEHLKASYDEARGDLARALDDAKHYRNRYLDRHRQRERDVAEAAID